MGVMIQAAMQDTGKGLPDKLLAILCQKRVVCQVPPRLSLNLFDFAPHCLRSMPEGTSKAIVKQNT
ncbi:MAG: hypothetical protein V3U95_03465, partial [Dehalococcoidia bacterium]